MSDTASSREHTQAHNDHTLSREDIKSRVYERFQVDEAKLDAWKAELRAIVRDRPSPTKARYEFNKNNLPWGTPLPDVFYPKPVVSLDQISVPPQLNPRHVELHATEARNILSAMMVLRERWFKTSQEAFDAYIKIHQFEALDIINKHEIEAGAYNQKIFSLTQEIDTLSTEYEIRKNWIAKILTELYKEVDGVPSYGTAGISAIEKLAVDIASFQSHDHPDEIKNPTRTLQRFRSICEGFHWENILAEHNINRNRVEKTQETNRDRLRYSQDEKNFRLARDEVERQAIDYRFVAFLESGGALDYYHRLSAHAEELYSLFNILAGRICLLRSGLQNLYLDNRRLPIMGNLNDLEPISLWLTDVEEYIRRKKRSEKIAQFAIEVSKMPNAQRDLEFKGGSHVFNVDRSHTDNDRYRLTGVNVSFLGSRVAPVGVSLEVPNGGGAPIGPLVFGACRNFASQSAEMSLLYSDRVWNMEPYGG